MRVGRTHDDILDIRDSSGRTLASVCRPTPAPDGSCGPAHVTWSDAKGWRTVEEAKALAEALLKAVARAKDLEAAGPTFPAVCYGCGWKARVPKPVPKAWLCQGCDEEKVEEMREFWGLIPSS